MSDNIQRSLYLLCLLGPFLSFFPSFAAGKEPVKPALTQGEDILRRASHVRLQSIFDRHPLTTAGVEKNAPAAMEEFRKVVLGEETMLRGEWPEIEPSMEKLLLWSLERWRSSKESLSSRRWLKEDGLVWSKYLERLPFDESTFTSLEGALRFQGLLLDEIQHQLEEWSGSGEDESHWNEDSLAWLNSLNLSASPLDRIFLAEARSRIKVEAQRRVQFFFGRITRQIQMNPHRTLKEFVAGARASGIVDFQKELEPLWAEKSVAIYKATFEKWNRLRLLVVRRLYGTTNPGEALDSLDVVVRRGWLREKPLHFGTRQPWQMKEL